MAGTAGVRCGVFRRRRASRHGGWPAERGPWRATTGLGSVARMQGTGCWVAAEEGLRLRVGGAHVGSYRPVHYMLSPPPLCWRLSVQAAAFLERELRTREQELQEAQRQRRQQQGPQGDQKQGQGQAQGQGGGTPVVSHNWSLRHGSYRHYCTRPNVVLVGTWLQYYYATPAKSCGWNPARSDDIARRSGWGPFHIHAALTPPEHALQLSPASQPLLPAFTPCRSPSARWSCWRPWWWR